MSKELVKDQKLFTEINYKKINKLIIENICYHDDIDDPDRIYKWEYLYHIPPLQLSTHQFIFQIKYFRSIKEITIEKLKSLFGQFLDNFTKMCYLDSTISPSIVLTYFSQAISQNIWKLDYNSADFDNLILESLKKISPQMIENDINQCFNNYTLPISLAIIECYQSLNYVLEKFHYNLELGLGDFLEQDKPEGKKIYQTYLSNQLTTTKAIHLAQVEKEKEIKSLESRIRKLEALLEKYQEVPETTISKNVRKQPRRSGFNVFCDEFMKLTIERYPEESDTERFKILASEWRELTSQQKKEYIDKAQPVNYIN